MAIQPRFAQAILAGSKTIEFRKRSLAPDVRTVLIYETAPTQRIVGEFEVDAHIVASPTGLWHRFASVGGIDAGSYEAYYAGRARAVGLKIVAAQAYVRAVSLREIAPSPAVPQSFSYLSASLADQVRALSACEVLDAAAV